MMACATPVIAQLAPDLPPLAFAQLVRLGKQQVQGVLDRNPGRSSPAFLDLQSVEPSPTDSARLRTALDSVLPTVHVDSAARWLIVRVDVRLIAPDRILIDWSEALQIRCRIGRPAGSGLAASIELRRLESGAWASPDAFRRVTVGDALSCELRRAPG